MKDECVICGAPLVYYENDREMECSVCGKRESSKAACEKGHYVCNDCHTRGIDSIMGVCLSHTSKDPVEILRYMMALPFCHMHGPEHHIMVGCALLTAYKNAGGQLELEAALIEMQSRAKKVPGGACGFWGACGAGIGAGMFMSIVTGATPLKNREWALSNLMTSQALGAIAANGGPRCCKRNSYTAIIKAAELCRQQLSVEMELSEIKCIHYGQNNQCIGERCPFR